jgi:hypothetical protein
MIIKKIVFVTHCGFPTELRPQNLLSLFCFNNDYDSCASYSNKMCVLIYYNTQVYKRLHSCFFVLYTAEIKAFSFSFLFYEEFFKHFHSLLIFLIISSFMTLYYINCTLRWKESFAINNVIESMEIKMKEWWMKFLVFRAVWGTFGMKPGIISCILFNWCY